jgi:hypothetical protein
MVTPQLALFYDIAKTAKGGAPVSLGFTLLVHFHSDVLAHAPGFSSACSGITHLMHFPVLLTCNHITSMNEPLSRPRDSKREHNDH